MKNLLNQLLDGKILNKEDMKVVARALFSDEITDSEIAAVLSTLKLRGETIDEITAIVEVLREHAMPITNYYPGVMDNCGTGGDRSYSFNISTTTSFVLAGAGVKVAKHGNRSVSSKSGSADVLEQLGIALDFSSEEVEHLLDKVGIAFLFAPNVHPKMKRIMKVRKELGVPTIFNFIGPLTNPVQLDTQFLGVYRQDMIMKLAEVLKQLGRKRGIVISGTNGMDEASLEGVNELVLLAEGELIPFSIRAEDVGLPSYPNEKIRGGDAKVNAEILLNVLKGELGPFLDTVLFNAGIGLFAAGKVATIKDGVALARETIETGRALEKLNELIAYSEKRNRKVMSI